MALAIVPLYIICVPFSSLYILFCFLISLQGSWCPRGIVSVAVFVTSLIFFYHLTRSSNIVPIYPESVLLSLLTHIFLENNFCTFELLISIFLYLALFFLKFSWSKHLPHLLSAFTFLIWTVSTHTHTHSHIHAHIPTFTHIYTFIHTTPLHRYKYNTMHIYIPTLTHILTHTLTHMHIIYIYKHTHICF